LDGGSCRAEKDEANMIMKKSMYDFVQIFLILLYSNFEWFWALSINIHIKMKKHNLGMDFM